MNQLTHIQLNGMKKTANVMLFSECEALIKQIGTAFQQIDFTVNYHCFEFSIDNITNIEGDIAILDLGFHVPQGLSLLKDIKSKFPDVPVIVLAEKGSEEQVIAAFRLGARDYFKKPLNMEHLIKMAKSLIHIKHASRERRWPVSVEMSQMWSACAAVRTDMPAPIHKSLLYMNDRLSDNITIAELAQSAGISKHHFCRTFKKSTGLTAMQMLSSLRIERAKWLLKSTDFAISKVAVEAGFNDIGSFTRHFKKVTGITARDYRTSLKLRE